MTSILNNPEFEELLPSSFKHGYSTAATQIEGGAFEDGKGLTIWDIKLKDKKDTPTVAVDHYHMWREDVSLLKSYGVNTYRFSIAWARIKPLGGKDDPVNEAGIRFYSDLIDALLAAGITPFVTIFHWDLPLNRLAKYQGFAADNKEDIIEDFVAYADVLFERFGDRVKNWITINEPHIFVMCTVLGGTPETGVTQIRDPITAGHRLILGHAHVVDLYRRKHQPSQGGQIGITLDCEWAEPIDDSIQAKKAAEMGVGKVMGWFADPIYLGQLNEHWLADKGDKFLDFEPEEWKLIMGSSDFFGLNHYSTAWATGRITPPNAGILPLMLFGGIERIHVKDGVKIGRSGHQDHPYDVPWGFRKLLNYIHKRYTAPLKIPIIITENGFIPKDECSAPLKDQINDVHRQEYFEGYLTAMFKAIKEDGVWVDGYMAWSFLDNLEWSMGFQMQFGVTHVDRANGYKRTPKGSSRMMKQIFEYVVKKE